MDQRQALLQRMFSRADEWKQKGDNRFVFLNCYALMSRNMVRAIEEGQFRDTVWVSQLMHHFADYYFIALDQYERLDNHTPMVWRHAHDTTRQTRLWVLQYLLLGINAHINYDLVLALADVLLPEWKHLTADQREQRYLDHTHVNTIIARTVDTVQDTVVEVHTPWMDLIDRLCWRLDEWAISRLICHWREEVWESAVQLVNASSATEREKLKDRLAKKVLERATKLSLDL